MPETLATEQQLSHIHHLAYLISFVTSKRPPWIRQGPSDFFCWHESPGEVLARVLGLQHDGPVQGDLAKEIIANLKAKLFQEARLNFLYRWPVPRLSPLLAEERSVTVGKRVPEGDHGEFVVTTIQELMALPPAERALAASLAQRGPMPQAENAWPTGAMVRKRNSPRSDFHTDGALARVVGSTPAPDWVKEQFLRSYGREVTFFYLVVFDDLAMPVAVPDDHLELVDG